MDDFVIFKEKDDDNPYKKLMGADHPREKTIQILLSLTLGVIAFLAFCILRPRWTGLYAARKKQKNEATALPELPNTLFGWIVPLWRITDQQVLASAGMDAYAFLAFFKLAMKFLVVTLFFSLIVIKPVHDANPEENHNKTHGHKDDEIFNLYARKPVVLSYNATIPGFSPEDYEINYLWMYVVFAYLFSGIAIYLIISETRKIIEVRQEYLGTQTSVTDRTIRLSGIPYDLQDEQKIKERVESLDIGRVESVTLCRNWKELDDTIVGRMDTLRRLEEAYTVHLGYRRIERSRETLPISQPSPPHPRPDSLAADEEDADADGLLGANGQAHIVPYDRARPQTRIWYGFMRMHNKKVDAIDHYEEKLRKTDERIKELRSKTFQPTTLAFVTMDSVASCQMAIQAVLDPSPQQLIAKQSPAPADVIWANTYLPKRNRMIRQWTITTVIVFLTVFWTVIFLPIAGALNTETIGKVFPQLAKVLDDHENVRSLVNTQLPTLALSLLTVLVPYLYYWLSWYQGMISQGDVELSAISKNFFFVFFNFFIVFTVLGTASQFYQLFQRIGEAIRDWRKAAYLIAVALTQFAEFYTNFIILQGLGLFPFRLLEVGSVALYPITRIGAKTPRDFAELVQPPIFSYGFYLPNALLIFIICMVYSVLRSSWQILLAGLVYFSFGHFVYKYQLLYAMDHQQQATGGSWVMICDRIFVGLFFFQIATAGQLIFKSAVGRSVLMVPLIIATIWTSIVFGRTYKPLMKFIALSSVKRGEQYRDGQDSPPDAESTASNDLAPERRAWAETGGEQLRYFRETRTGLARAVDDWSETNQRFINPSLVAPLDEVWIADKDFRREGGVALPEGDETV